MSVYVSLKEATEHDKAFMNDMLNALTPEDLTYEEKLEFVKDLDIKMQIPPFGFDSPML